MEKLWQYVNRTALDRNRKYTLYLILHVLIWSFIGLAVWWGVHFFAFGSLWCAFCFVGYAGFFAGFLGGVWYLWKM